MTKALENAAWYRGKRPLVDEYLQTAKQVESAVAMRGHLYRPGFLGGEITQVERNLKLKLSDVNYAIVKEAIERDLAQTGFDYDIAYKEAQIAWELEKTQLLTALEQEFAHNKKLRELDKQDLDRLEIKINLRKLILIAEKTGIDEDMEELRQEMVSVEQSTYAAEDALLAAKLLTAQKKLEVIPYIETVLEKQQEIIDAETANADSKEVLITKKEDLNDKKEDLITAREAIATAIIDLIAAKQSLIEKRSDLLTAKGLVVGQEQTNVEYLNQYISTLSGLSDVQQDLVAAKRALIPKINEKSMALIAYAAELDAWVVVKNAIANVKEEIAILMETRADKKGDIIDAKVSLNTLELALDEAQINLEIAKLTGKTNLMDQKIKNASEMLTERQSSFNAKIVRENELISGQIDLDLYGATSAYETMQAVNDIAIPSQLHAQRAVGGYRVVTKRALGAIAANAELSSKLVHLLT
jgi:hypothetical protein